MISTRARQQFDDLLDRVIAELPPRLHELLEEVPLIVEDEPGPALLDEVAVGDGDLCGLHWGTALTERSVDAGGDPPGVPGVPDRMMLFRGPILRLSGCTEIGRARVGTAELYRQVKITLLHEIGHHFGLDEDALAGLGYA